MVIVWPWTSIIRVELALGSNTVRVLDSKNTALGFSDEAYRYRLASAAAASAPVK
jgi:hypothetical protein